MGLFSNLFGRKDNGITNNGGDTSPSGYEFKPWDYKPWDLPEPTQHIELTGKKVAKVYLYDATPIDYSRLHHLVLEIARGDYEMTSLYTDSIWNSSFNGNVAVLFNGSPIGFVELPRDEIKALMERGYEFSIVAFEDGWWSEEHDVPNLKSHVPNNRYFENLLNPPDKSKKRLKNAEYYFDTSYGDLDFAPRYEKRCLEKPCIVIRETNNSAKGKPSALLCDEDHIVAEFPTRLKCHGEIAGLVDRNIVKAVYERHGDSKPRIAIELVVEKGQGKK